MSEQTCPKCNRGNLVEYPDGRKCGCEACMAVFRLPSMEVIFEGLGVEHASE